MDLQKQDSQELEQCAEGTPSVLLKSFFGLKKQNDLINSQYEIFLFVFRK